MSQENVELVQRMYYVWNRGGGVLVLESIDPEVEVDVVGGLEPGTYWGHAGLSKVLESFWGSFAQSRIEVEECITAGDDVIVRRPTTTRVSMAGFPPRTSRGAYRP